eukprot:TRINITY_DN14899_c1_g1_i1.p1 TRINITY_DN14899_c1_g1~~TRINITY_DN14899_c1_g1_i1.p1  ORF type:complete len:243 (+),score=45.15 TRINITY_DN14899_c1_g1_i1:1227-1955(+)
MCEDWDTAAGGTFNCTCLPPYNGTRRGAAASCWHDDCRQEPCGEGQRCSDDDPDRGLFRCHCGGGSAYSAANRRALCVWDECSRKAELAQCDSCSDPAPVPDSVEDWLCSCGAAPVIGGTCDASQRGAASGAADGWWEDSSPGPVAGKIAIAVSAALLIAFGALGVRRWQRRRARLRLGDFSNVVSGTMDFDFDQRSSYSEMQRTQRDGTRRGSGSPTARQGSSFRAPAGPGRPAAGVIHRV